MNRPARPGERRDLRVLRRGAEQGFAQVLTGPELVELLDRLADAERVETAASKLSECETDRDLEEAVADVLNALCFRKTRPEA
jgi:hypothetical protein